MLEDHLQGGDPGLGGYLQRSIHPVSRSNTAEIRSADNGVRHMTPKQKVFGIGFHKTGTTSLANALRVLGYRVTGPNGVYDEEIASRVQEMAWALVEQYDAFQDNPWPLLYQELDQRYPGSKFILTIRPTDRWIGSVARHFGGATTPMREWIYGNGDPAGIEDVYVARYEQHNAEVMEYFEGRPDDLLVMRLTDGDAWPELCGFLGVDVPSVEFPLSNKAEDRENRSLGTWLMGRLSRVGRRLKAVVAGSR